MQWQHLAGSQAGPDYSLSENWGVTFQFKHLVSGEQPLGD